MRDEAVYDKLSFRRSAFGRIREDGLGVPELRNVGESWICAQCLRIWCKNGDG